MVSKTIWSLLSQLAVVILVVFLVAGGGRSGAFARQPAAVLLLHGFNSDHTTWDAFTKNLPVGYVYAGNLRERIPGKNFTLDPPAVTPFASTGKSPVFTMDFSDAADLSLKEQAVEIKDALAVIQPAAGPRRVILFGHSMGGLAARRYIMEYGTGQVAGLVTVGTPHAGSYLGYVQDFLDDKAADKQADLKSLKSFVRAGGFFGGIDFNSYAARNLIPTSPQMQEMYGQVFPPDLPVVQVLSDWDASNFDFNKDGISDTWVKNALGWIALLFEKNYEQVRGNDVPLSKFYSINLRNRFHDGIVSFVAQDIRLGVANGSQLKVESITTDKFHTAEPGDIATMKRALEKISVMIQPPTALARTVIALDHSGSMAGEKLTRAKRAVNDFVDALALETRAGFADNRVALVTFSTAAASVSGFVPPREEIRRAVSGVGTGGNTNIGAALDASLLLFGAPGGSHAGRSVTVLFTDGRSNEGLTEAQILQGPVQRHVKRGIPIFTVGLGGKGDLNESFLQRVAGASGGAYFHSLNAGGLEAKFRMLLHTITGVVKKNLTGTIQENQWIDLGMIQVKPGTPALRFSLGWPGSKLRLEVTDPNGKMVDQSYSGATVFESGRQALLIVKQPVAGDWKVRTFGEDVAPGGEAYDFAASEDKPPPTPPDSVGTFIKRYRDAMRQGNVSALLGLYDTKFRDDAGLDYDGLFEVFMSQYEALPYTRLEIVDKIPAAPTFPVKIPYRLIRPAGITINGVWILEQIGGTIKIRAARLLDWAPRNNRK